LEGSSWSSKEKKKKGGKGRPQKASMQTFFPIYFQKCKGREVGEEGGGCTEQILRVHPIASRMAVHEKGGGEEQNGSKKKLFPQSGRGERKKRGGIE